MSLQHTTTCPETLDELIGPTDPRPILHWVRRGYPHLSICGHWLNGDLLPLDPTPSTSRDCEACYTILKQRGDLP